MNKLLVTITLSAALLFITPPPPSAQAAHKFGVELFYDALSPYGEWVEVDDYGYCWHPTEVNRDWRPYTVGRWVYTDVGWTWASDEPFGWAVFHYGRWLYIANIGWSWVPDTEWASAWVSFRHNDDYIGWAPLPPEAHFWGSIGFSNWVDAYYDIGPLAYCFVPYRRFCSPMARDEIFRSDRNFDYFSTTVNVTNITRRENVTYVGGLNFQSVASRSETSIRQLQLERQTDIDPTVALNGARMNSKIESDRLVLAAPVVSAITAVTPPKSARKLRGVKVERGWEKVANPDKARALKAKVRSEIALPAALPPEPKYDKVLSSPPPKQETTSETVVPELPRRKSDRGTERLIPQAPNSSPELVTPKSKPMNRDVPLVTPEKSEIQNKPQHKSKELVIPRSNPPTVTREHDIIPQPTSSEKMERLPKPKEQRQITPANVVPERKVISPPDVRKKTPDDEEKKKKKRGENN